MNYKKVDRFFGNLAHIIFENKSSLKLGPSKLFLISKNYLLLSSLMCAILFNAIGVANLILIYGFGEVFSTSFLNTSKHKYLIIRIIFCSTIHALSLKLSFMSAKENVSFIVFAVTFLIVCQMKQFIVLAVQCFFLWRNKGRKYRKSDESKMLHR